MIEEVVIRKTGRVPRPAGPVGDGAGAARQLDAALLTVRFKLSAELMTELSQHASATVIDVGTHLLDVVRTAVGDHVAHNTYFRDFPANVPDTMRFWVRCIRDALLDPRSRATIERQLSVGTVNLLDLPRYGRYQHSYEDLLAAHAELIPAASDRLTVIGLGASLEDEAQALYLTLAERSTPPSADDLLALRELAAFCVDGPQPAALPMRENRAVVNGVRAANDGELMIDTVTDVLRLACAMSDGDVTLLEPTRFRSFRRPERRLLLAALHTVVAADHGKLGDVGAHREPWKRLGERLHPHEYARYPSAAKVFAVARGDERAPSAAARIEAAFDRHDLAGVLAAQQRTPGMLLRSLDRLLRAARSEADHELIISAVTSVIGDVSGRVVLSVREHLDNRRDEDAGRRIFVNRAGRAWAAPDTRDPLADAVVVRLTEVLDAEISRRLPPVEHLVVHRELLDVALPLSAKTTPPGVGLRPRGSVSPVDGQLLRFFVYWHEAHHTTDFDLSALLLDENLGNPRWLSYTNLTTVGGRHSGDVVEAPNGASEFIDLELRSVDSRVIVPQVNVYSGEGFDEVAESFFGFMLREQEQRGMPFEARTVRMKSDLRGPSRVALPLAFVLGDDGRWRAHWLQLFLRGEPAFNRVEDNRISTTELVRGVLDRRYLTVRYLIDRLQPARVSVVDDDSRPTEPHRYLGRDSLDGLRDLIPE